MLPISFGSLADRLPTSPDALSLPCTNRSRVLQRELTAEVRQALRSLGRSTDGGWRLMVKAVAMILWFMVSYCLLVFWSSSHWTTIPLMMSLGGSLAGIGLAVQHDGGHRSFSSSRRLNRLAAFGLDFIGVSSYVWRYKHNRQHHVFTNMEGLDDDLDATPFLRLAPGQAAFAVHRWQHVYAWLLYALVPLKWHYFDEPRCLIRRRIGGEVVPFPTGGELVLLILGKLLFLSWAVVIPMSFHPVVSFSLAYLGVMTVMGLLLASVFQLAHCVEGCAVPLEERERLTDPDSSEPKLGWLEHQLATTTSFSTHRFVHWFLGGLNLQIEHHLFPSISHIHYDRVTPIVRSFCVRNDLPYRRYPSFRAALRSHYYFLRTMGRPNKQTSSPHRCSSSQSATSGK